MIRISNTTNTNLRRSLSSRNVELWFNNGADGIAQGHLHAGQETTACAYPGHRFFVTEVGHKDRRITEFFIHSTQVSICFLVTEFLITHIFYFCFLRFLC